MIVEYGQRLKTGERMLSDDFGDRDEDMLLLIDDFCDIEDDCDDYDVDADNVFVSAEPRSNP